MLLLIFNADFQPRTLIVDFVSYNQGAVFSVQHIRPNSAWFVLFSSPIDCNLKTIHEFVLNAIKISGQSIGISIYSLEKGFLARAP